MLHNPQKNMYMGLFIILFLGLGWAMTLPVFEGMPILAAQNEIPELTRYYVAKTGDNSDPTLGWSTANQSLQDTLIQVAFTGGGEVWVAAGVYFPDEGGSQTDNAPASTFLLFENITLYGGFDTGDSKLSDRDWVKNVTVLSGDIDGNDITNLSGVVIDPANIKGNNAYHVVSASGVKSSAVIDGFTITAGHAYGFKPDNRGAGFFCDGSGSGNYCNPTFRNITFSGNWADSRGGAMYNDGKEGESSPNLKNVAFFNNRADSRGGAVYNDGNSGISSLNMRFGTFSGNSAGSFGGAIYNDAYNGTSSANLTSVTFSGNEAGSKGGAVYNEGSFSGTNNPSLMNVTFSENKAGSRGGAMYNNGYQGTCSPFLLDVIFSGNSADKRGGAMYNEGSSNGFSSPSLINALFSGNSADFGGAMYNEGSSGGTSIPEFVNVIFSGNSAISAGGAIYNDGSSGSCSPILDNSIVWNNQITGGSILRILSNRGISAGITDNIYNDSSTITFYNSLIQGSGGSGSWIGGDYTDGGSNIDGNPEFVTPIDPFDAPTTDGNLRLKSGSPAIDLGNNIIIAGVFTDLDGRPRIVDGNLDGTEIVDMGAYETQFNQYLPIIKR